MIDLVLIPCARLVPQELQVEFGPVPSGMVPLRGRPALAHIYESPSVDRSHIMLALHEGADEVHTWLARQADLVLDVVDVGPTRYLGETVLLALRARSVDPDRLVIHFADTLVTDELPDGDFVLCRRQDDTFRYTTFVSSPDGSIDVTSEPGDMGSDSQEELVFVGVFGVTEVRKFETLLEVAVNEGIREGVDPFYVALTRYSAALGTHMTIQPAEGWYDFGHLDTYYDTKRSLFMGARSFNVVDVDSSRGVIRKSSTHKAKFMDEILWYLRIPKRLAHIAPRIFDYSVDPLDPWVEMEFYGYPTLNDAYLVGQWDIGVWNRVFSALGTLLAEMQAHTYRPIDVASLHAAAHDMYLVKTLDRLSELRSTAADWMGQLGGPIVKINGVEMRGLSQVEADLAGVLERSGVMTPNELTVMHGDLCLSNLLYDRRNGIVRTIDPRGRFGSFDIYGDPLYDLAKLAHSIEGDYDLILAGRFTLARSDVEVHLSVHASAEQERIKSLFARWQDRTESDRLSRVRLVESLLFLSLVPLHADNPAAQEAFLVRGLERFHEAAGAHV